MTDVSVVIPVRNGAPWIRAVLDAVFAQEFSGATEVLVVDDRSTDTSAAIVREYAMRAPIRLIQGPGRGAAKAINVGVMAARYPLIAQIDQDVVIDPGWLTRLVDAISAGAAAAQGCYVADRSDSRVARVMALDLEQRYASVGIETDHVCTGNAVYRADALREVGLFDERMGYGYDNDMSYRLRDAGYRLVFCRDATSRHRWRDTLGGYTTQQYGFGYGRLALVAKHPHRMTGDAVSPAGMMAHPAAMAAAIFAAALAAVFAAAGGPWRLATIASLAMVGALVLERTLAGVRASRQFDDRAALLFPLLHLWRDLVWVFAIAVWLARRAFGQHGRPSDSMRARPVSTAAATASRPLVKRVLGVIPAHNEADSLAAVVNDIRSVCPSLALLVVDDGSTDKTAEVLESLDVPHVRLPQRMGIGSAMRAGLRYAARLKFDTVVRLDGDGQHRASDIDRVLAPLRDRIADVVLGSRFATGARSNGPLVRIVHQVLGRCLSLITGRAVTDPTSGFCAFGPRAVKLLAEHHPTGYPEPELRLLISRSGLTDVEVPISVNARVGGRTSLTAPRLAGAAARVLLAIVIVPLRHSIGGDRD